MDPTSPYLPWIVLLVSILFLLYACRALIEDAKGGYDITMGESMLFSTAWFTGAAGAATGLTLLLEFAWWWGIAAFVAIYLLQGAVRWIITTLYLGTEAPPPPKNGFKDFIRKTERKDDA